MIERGAICLGLDFQPLRMLVLELCLGPSESHALQVWIRVAVWTRVASLRSPVTLREGVAPLPGLCPGLLQAQS